jgi:hypothetical protein
MGPIRLIAAPIRRIANSRLFQLAVVLAIILVLDHYSFDYAALHALADGLQKLVAASIALCSQFFRVGILTDPVLQVGLMIGYVYVACLFVFVVLRYMVRKSVDLAGRSNFLWLRNTIARERGIAAYQAWLPLERIRPADCPQDKWEEQFGWPADDKPPYPPLWRRLVGGVLGYAAVLAGAAGFHALSRPHLDRRSGVKCETRAAGGRTRRVGLARTRTAKRAPALPPGQGTPVRRHAGRKLPAKIGRAVQSR